MTITKERKDNNAETAHLHFVLSQVEVNKAILQIVNEAKSSLFFMSMMSELSDPALLLALNDAVARGVDVEVFHNVNPYVTAPTLKKGQALGFQFNIIEVPMHGSRVPNFISTLLGGTYINPVYTNVTHARFIANGTHCMFGGVDFYRVCEAKNYVQHAIRIDVSTISQQYPCNSIAQHLEELISEATINHNLHSFSPSKLSCSSSGRISSSSSRISSSSSSSGSDGGTSCTSNASSALIATTAVDTSAREAILYMVHEAQYHIFIENQYFEHKNILSSIAQQQKKHPSLKVVLVGNYEFDRNPYHPGKYFSLFGLSKYGNYSLKKETMAGLRYLREQGCRFEFRIYQGQYTHNKIFITDHGKSIAMGTFNLHRRGLDAGNDYEIGVLLNDNTAEIGVGEEESFGEAKKEDRGHILNFASTYIDHVHRETFVMNEVYKALD